jgi:hypothetical protein
MPSRAEPLRSALTRAQRTRWATPASAIALGLVAFAVEAARGDVGGGVGFLVIMTVYAGVLLLFGGRSEVVSLLRGDTGDERASQLQLKALAATGGVLVPVLVAGFLIELARGAADLGVWTWLCSLAGVTFALSLAILSRRS